MSPRRRIVAPMSIPVAPPVGERFGRLVVSGDLVFKRRSDGRNRSHVPVRCDCGQERTVLAGNLYNGNTLSCGCLHRQQAGDANRTHGRSRTPLYRIWKSMRDRCTNANADNYRFYGAKGVTVDASWNDFRVFADWAENAGYEVGLELDRIDPGRPYEPSNCRWATKRDNIKTARLLPRALDERLSAYAAEQGISRSAAIERALEQHLPQSPQGA